ncbi:MAG: NUDIX domain-containing protein [Alphaproteobacteria bacterium]|nr:NUDIX domain-containing protein [Alphaproteobacteria bacterium]
MSDSQDQGRRKRKRRRSGPRGTRGEDSWIPDILYHGTTVGRAQRYRRAGYVHAGQSKRVFLSDEESEAWRVAHRFKQSPEVLYVDAGRARRTGLTIRRVREGLYVATQIPARHVLNLRDGFREQLSAGGMLVRWDRGEPELAMVSCVRRGRATWEIAKGKLEEGETPEQAAMRELQEEMGFEAELNITHRLGAVRYGFRTPEGDPRLKTLHVYLIEAVVPPEVFTPAEAEGIREVRWFPLDEACRLVTHTSLLPVMREVQRILRPPLDAEAPSEQ